MPNYNYYRLKPSSLLHSGLIVVFLMLIKIKTTTEAEKDLNLNSFVKA